MHPGLKHLPPSACALHAMQAAVSQLPCCSALRAPPPSPQLPRGKVLMAASRRQGNDADEEDPAAGGWDDQPKRSKRQSARNK